MPGLGDLDARIEKMERARDDIVTATREAHSTIKELRAEIKEARALLATDHFAERVSKAADEQVAPKVEQMLGELKVRVESIYDKVSANVQLLANEAMYGNKAGTGLNLFEEMRQRVEAWKRIEQEHDRRVMERELGHG